MMGAVTSADRPVRQPYEAPAGTGARAVELLMKVAVVVGAGFSRGEIGQPLDAERVDLGDRPGTDE
jgi:hypothetical protein